MEFISSRKNRDNLVNDGFVYNFHKTNKDGSKKTYRCQKRNSKNCHATAVVEGDIVTPKGTHSHLPNLHEIEKTKTLKKIYDLGIQSPRELPNAVYSEHTRGMDDEVAARMPLYSSIQQNIARIRKKNGVERKMETSLNDLEVQEDLKKLENGEEFLYYDSGKDDPERIIIFATKENLKFNMLIKMKEF